MVVAYPERQWIANHTHNHCCIGHKSGVVKSFFQIVYHREALLATKFVVHIQAYFFSSFWDAKFFSLLSSQLCNLFNRV